MKFFSIPCLMDPSIEVLCKDFHNLNNIATCLHLFQNGTFLPKSVSLLSFICPKGPIFTQLGPLMTFNVHKKFWVPKVTSPFRTSVFIIFLKKLLVYFLSYFLHNISPCQLIRFVSRFLLWEANWLNKWTVKFRDKWMRTSCQAGSIFEGRYKKLKKTHLVVTIYEHVHMSISAKCPFSA